MDEHLSCRKKERELQQGIQHAMKASDLHYRNFMAANKRIGELQIENNKLISALYGRTVMSKLKRFFGVTYVRFKTKTQVRSPDHES